MCEQQHRGDRRCDFYSCNSQWEYRKEATKTKWRAEKLIHTCLPCCHISYSYQTTIRLAGWITCPVESRLLPRHSAHISSGVLFGKGHSNVNSCFSKASLDLTTFLYQLLSQNGCLLTSGHLNFSTLVNLKAYYEQLKTQDFLMYKNIHICIFHFHFMPIDLSSILK